MRQPLCPGETACQQCSYAVFPGCKVCAELVELRKQLASISRRIKTLADGIPIVSSTPDCSQCDVHAHCMMQLCNQLRSNLFGFQTIRRRKPPRCIASTAVVSADTVVVQLGPPPPRRREHKKTL